MKHLLDSMNRYIKGMEVSDIVLLKTSMISGGILLGLAIPKRLRKAVVFWAVLVFLLSYIPMILKLLGAFCPSCAGGEEE